MSFKSTHSLLSSPSKAVLHTNKYSFSSRLQCEHYRLCGDAELLHRPAAAEGSLAHRQRRRARVLLHYPNPQVNIFGLSLTAFSTLTDVIVYSKCLQRSQVIEGREMPQFILGCVPQASHNSMARLRGRFSFMPFHSFPNPQSTSQNGASLFSEAQPLTER